MDLRIIYSVISALLLATAFSSCSTKRYMSYAPGAAMRPAYSQRAEHARAKAIKESAPKRLIVRTTAYSHQERDSWKYGKSTAAGTKLK